MEENKDFIAKLLEHKEDIDTIYKKQLINNVNNLFSMINIGLFYIILLTPCIFIWTNNNIIFFKVLLTLLFAIICSELYRYILCQRLKR